MFVTLFFVKGPDIEAAKKFDKEYALLIKNIDHPYKDNYSSTDLHICEHRAL